MCADRKPIAIYHEHPDWFRPLFAELDRRSLPYVKLDPRAHTYDPAERVSPYSLVFNRMSPSAYLRGGIQGMFYTLGFLAHLDRLRVPTMNGLGAFTFETSKARQLTLLQSLNLPYPRARVINHPSKAAAAGRRAAVPGRRQGERRRERGRDRPVRRARRPGPGGGRGAARLRGRSHGPGAGVRPRPRRAYHAGRAAGGKYLYAIKVFTPGDTFNLCPADICQRSDGVELTRTACPVDAPKTGLKVEAYTPPDEVIDACEAIVREAEIDVGGIEYMIDDRDGRLVYYDINALSNFVADAVNVVGFDPFARLVDVLDRRSLVGWLPRQPKRQELAFPDAEVWDAAD